MPTVTMSLPMRLRLTCWPAADGGWRYRVLILRHEQVGGPWTQHVDHYHLMADTIGSEPMMQCPVRRPEEREHA